MRPEAAGRKTLFSKQERILGREDQKLKGFELSKVLVVRLL